jgi:porin
MKWLFAAALLTTATFNSVLFASDSTPTNKQHKAGYDNEEGLSGPGGTTQQLEKNDEQKSTVFRLPAIDKTLKPWFNFKKSLNDKYGLQLGIAYSTTYQKVDDTLPERDDEGMTGIFRVAGKWELINRGGKNKGSFVFSVDNRSNYKSVAAADTGSQAGYIGPTATIFSAPDTVLVDFNWQQYINDGKTGILIGRFDPMDFLHVQGSTNPWGAFQNLNTLLDSSIAYPDVGVGAGASHWFKNKYYVMGGFNDANGRLTEEGAYYDGGEFFKFAEIGWSPGRDQRYFKNVHLSFWQVDDRDEDGVDGASGVALGVNWTWDNTWMLFSKIGLSDADAANDPQIYEESYTVGGMYYFAGRSDLLGLAINHGELAASGLNSQTTSELFYRIQLAQNLAVTPSVQVLQDPALNSEEDTVMLYGIRMRLTL